MLSKHYWEKPLWELICWIIILIIVFWAMMQEYTAATCYDGRDSCGSAWAWDPQPGDKPEDLVRRIEFANRAQGFVISRRLVMIASIGLSLILLWYFRKRVIPDIVEFVIVFVLIMGVLWFAFRYHESHYLYEIVRRSDFSIQELRYQMGISKRPANVGA